MRCASPRSAIDPLASGWRRSLPDRGDLRLATTIIDLRTGTFVRVGIHHANIEASWRAHREAYGGELALASAL
ncbi:MAG: hypothetical protein IAG13_21785 [Deltaproteobacteria bacterium]|nr:hypothetical protein [Nannocystaceae bacterium]